MTNTRLKISTGLVLPSSGPDVPATRTAPEHRVPPADLEVADAGVRRDIFDVNVFGVWQLTTAAVPHLRKSDAAAIVNVSSVSATRALGSSIPYAVSKAALNHLTRLLAAQLGPAIRVNAVAPGPIDTPWYEEAERVWEDSRDWITRNTLLRRVGTPEDVAEAVLYLARAAYTTGDVLTMDGGRHIV